MLALLEIDDQELVSGYLFLLCPDDDPWAAPEPGFVSEQVRLAARIQASRGPGKFVLCLTG